MPDLDRPMPQNLEAERAVLGSAMLDAKSLWTAREHLEDRHFYLESHRLIFQGMSALQDAGSGIDEITLRAQLGGELEKAGGIAYLSSLTNHGSRAANVAHYARLVRETWLSRRLIQIGNEVQARAYEGEEKPAKILEGIESDLLALTSVDTGEGFVSAARIVEDTFKEIEQVSNHRSIVTGISTGFTELDRMTGGLHGQNFVIVAGRPGQGKTSLVLNVADTAAIQQHKRVGILSLEMSRSELMHRLISSRAEVDGSRLRTGFESREDWTRITRASGEIGEAQLWIDDAASLTLQQIRARVHRQHARFGLDLLILDYLQLVSGSGRRDQNRTQEVTEISRGLKGMAKELNIPVVAVSQLSREPDKRRGRNARPQLSDLRESGAIEQDADLVVFIYREELADPKPENTGVAEIIIGKQRNGPTGALQLAFLKQYSKFADLYKPSTNNQEDFYWNDR